jgi:hypothetical protein
LGWQRLTVEARRDNKRTEENAGAPNPQSPPVCLERTRHLRQNCFR